MVYSLQPGEGRMVSGGETTRVFVSLVPSLTLSTTQAISPDTGTAYISSEPQGAEVSVDSVFRGTTPLKVMEIEKGTHPIVITKEGYELWETEITVQNASNYSIDARLVPVGTTGTGTTRMGVGGGFGGDSGGDSGGAFVEEEGGGEIILHP